MKNKKGFFIISSNNHFRNCLSERKYPEGTLTKASNFIISFYNLISVVTFRNSGKSECESSSCGSVNCKREKCALTQIMFLMNERKVARVNEKLLLHSQKASKLIFIHAQSVKAKQH
jgi:hypothetical protein